MDTSALSAPERGRRLRRAAGAFSLVEVSLAIGIIAFCFTAVIGMLPTGMSVFHQAMDASVGSQVVQRVLNESRQMDFDELCTDAGGNTIQAGASGLKSVRFFDEQGNEILSATSPVVYEVNTRVLVPTPAPGDANPSTVADVTVQIASNPAKRTIATDPTKNLWSDSTFTISTSSGLVARSK